MHIVVGPVLTGERGYAFDSWTPEDGLSRGYIYRRVADAYYTGNFEIRAGGKSCRRHRRLRHCRRLPTLDYRQAGKRLEAGLEKFREMMALQGTLPQGDD